MQSASWRLWISASLDSLRLPAVSPAVAESGATGRSCTISSAVDSPPSPRAFYSYELLLHVNTCLSLTLVTGFFSSASSFISFLFYLGLLQLRLCDVIRYFLLMTPFFFYSSSATTCLTCPTSFQSSVHLFPLLQESLEEKSSFDTLCAHFQTRQR